MKNIQKSYIYTLATAFLFSLFFISCNGDNNDDEIIYPTDETSGLTKIQELSNDTYTFSLYTKKGILSTGYNEIYLQVKNKTTGEFEKNASLTWNPIMHMTSKSHSCPYSSIEKVTDKQTLYKGFIIFQMASNDSEYWELTLNNTIGGQNVQVSDKVNVTNATKKRVQVFNGTDNVRYVLAMVEPSSPIVGLNILTAYLYKMQDMNTFVPINGYKIKVDPRMPSMGNHSSPNNIDMVYTGSTGFYQGKVSFTMTGYWKINLILLNQNDQVIKGEAVTENQDSSSLYFETEF